jgi:hypothetical protein
MLSKVVVVGGGFIDFLDEYASIPFMGLLFCIVPKSFHCSWLGICIKQG